jgi:transglutaminase-like putative cysteine protease
MILNICHTTEYLFSEPVFLEPHTFRFRPKSSKVHDNIDFRITIDPRPAGLAEQRDAEDNRILFCWFEPKTSCLKITSDSRVTVTNFNPFDFLIHPPEYLKVPFVYDPSTKDLLHHALESIVTEGSMHEYSTGILKETKRQSIPFLSALTEGIHRDFRLHSRESGPPYPPERTFRDKQGSCRDLAWLQIHMLRKHGIAARFVSGYLYLDLEDPEFELHSWVEAYLPGAGWIGLDPSHGILAGANHIPVACSVFPENTLPVSGTLRGKATSTLRHDLQITRVPDLN